MNRTIHAVINDRGQIKPQKPCEPAFAREWSRPEEDAAWQNLDQALL